MGIFLGVNPSDQLYADAVVEKMKGQDSSSWTTWRKAIRQVLINNNVSHAPDVSRRMRGIEDELRRRSVVATKARMKRQKIAEGIQRRISR